ncbi:hypothetical protein PFNF135_00909 [Plasmodium falciparum NF135/5.C10]|uniref:Surface antigen n=1 Tax=Plasmodium falciparum NF135/5.C10 TaxID=1036726 RepID=W4IMP3_PLAFA|nr:hypothetical protein PFNF135_00909 [Plasmodium falciparum NF135/5.C10]
MKVHYINILLFTVPLNILVTLCHVYNQISLHIRNHTPTTKSRLLCECDVYTSIYDNDPEMKNVMENFNKQTEERFHEYNERMQEKRKECKDQCEKDIQKIILKDKIEKELTEKLEALETNIKTEDIPTCVCEKSVADKVEKACLRCGGILGGGLEPTVGLLGTVVVNQLTKTATVASIEFVTQEGIKAGIKAVVHNLINVLHLFDVTRDIWLTLINSKNYNTVSGLTTAAKTAKEAVGTTCLRNTPRLKPSCDAIFNKSKVWFGPVK